MYGINSKVYNRLIDYFRNNSSVEKVILFGSRSKNIAKVNSDIDICIDYNGSNRGTIIFDIDELVGVYSSDILFYDSLNEEIKNQIDRDGIVIFQK